MRLIILLSVFLCAICDLSAQTTATFYTKTKSEVFSTDTSACTGCGSGITEVLVTSDSTFDCTKYTMVAFQAYGYAGQCAVIEFKVSANPLGKVPVCVGTGINVVNNGKVLGTAVVNIGSLTDYYNSDTGDTLAPSVICIAIK